MGVSKKLHKQVGKTRFSACVSIRKVEYYLKIVKSADSVIHNVFWAYLGYSFPKDDLCSCIFKGRTAGVLQWRKFLLTLQHSRLFSHDQ